MSSKRKKDSVQKPEYGVLYEPHEVDAYYLMFGKRYLRHASTWLRRGGALTLGRNPTADCQISFGTALEVAEKILNHKHVSDKDKRSLRMRRIRTQDYTFPVIEGRRSA